MSNGLSSLLKAACLLSFVSALALGGSTTILLTDIGANISNETARKAQNANHKTLSPQKRTPSALYLTSEQAYSWLEIDPDVLFVDVRDPLESSLMGHPKNIDAIVPVRVLSDTFDPKIQEYQLVDNPDFIDQMNEILTLFDRTKSQDLVVICGSGRRSAAAVRKLYKHGYTKVWHVTDGYPGEEKVGMNSDHAWRIAGLPWTTSDIVHGSSWHPLLCDDGTASTSCR